ncbi:MAG: hypothetical protein ACOCWC_00620 [Bacteroidota bacterium]
MYNKRKSFKKTQSDYNFLHVFAGLLIGFFLGSGIVYLNFNRQNDSLFEYVANFFSNENDRKKEPESRKKDISFNSPKTKKNNIQKKRNNDNINQYKEETGERAGLVKDKLIGVKTIVLNIDETVNQSNTTKELDSILGNVKSRRQNIENRFILEFWESPIDFQAYKMSKNKIILYGIDFNNNTSFEVYNNNIYLKYFDDYYALHETNVLEQLTPVSDFLLINQIENK